MTTTARNQTNPKPQQSPSGRRCPGCPRCQDQDTTFCNQPHPRFGNLHPVCKRCGHCVLRGDHTDNTSDLT